MLRDPYGKKRAALTQQELNAIMQEHARYAAGRGGLRAQLAHMDLDGLNLANRNLEEADFSGASLVGASLYGSNLHRANLYCADLRDCDLRMTKLVRADMRGASFKGARLAYAVLDNADMRSGMMMYVGPGRDLTTREGLAGGQRVIDSSEKPHAVDFSYCSMKGASFGNAKLDGANFTNALLQGATFKNARLNNAVFKGAVLTGVNLKELNVPPEALRGCVLDAVPQSAAKMEEIRLKLDAHEKFVTTAGQHGGLASLEGEDLRPVHALFVSRSLTGVSMCNVIGIGIDFSGSQLQAAKFNGADLRGANFSKVDLRGVSFKGANLLHANFEGADLRPLQLGKGSALAPNFSDAEVTDEQLQTAVLEKPAQSATA
jgi:uncharacterized protein YjbI with pentapeptide repeats